MRSERRLRQAASRSIVRSKKGLGRQAAIKSVVRLIEAGNWQASSIAP